MAKAKFKMYDGRTTRHEKAKTEQESPEELRKMLKTIEARIEAAERQRPKPLALPPAPQGRANLPDAQVQALLKMTEASLRQYGTIVPPKEVFYMTANATCPHCDHEGPITTDFGFKKSGKPQSWCRWCRGSKESHPGRYGLK